MNKKRIHFDYRYSYFWLILSLIFFFPLAFVLFITGTTFKYDHSSARLDYDGSRFWLAVWTVFFFPIAILLFFMNGFSICKETKGLNTKALLEE